MEVCACVIPGCATQTSGAESRVSPYCTKYHEKLDINRHYAANKGFFYVEGSWGPPWPDLLQSTSINSTHTELWDYISHLPASPEICGTSEQNEENDLMELIDLSPHSDEISKPPLLCRSISPKTEINYAENDQNTWHTKLSSTTKRKNVELQLTDFSSFSTSASSSPSSENFKRSRIENTLNNFNSEKNKRRSQPTLSLQYSSSGNSGGGSKTKSTSVYSSRQLNIGEYFQRKST